jgi:hypothetical protein
LDRLLQPHFTSGDIHPRRPHRLPCGQANENASFILSYSYRRY